MFNRAETYICHTSKTNFSYGKERLQIDKSKFKPEQCVFAGDGLIYWSYQSHTPDEIKLNGCGETYTYKRTQKGTPGLIEWIKYKPQK